jgi:hypothetical protein
MKKLMMAAIGLMMAVSANAQYLNDSGTPFEQGKFYVGASASSASLSYSKATDFSFGLNGKFGYMIIDNLMGLGVLEYGSYNNGDVITGSFGAGARWYFDKIGIYAGAVAKYCRDDRADAKDFRPEVHAGYAFFVSRHITLEPELYYEHSFKDSDLSGFGLRIGIGIYF